WIVGDYSIADIAIAPWLRSLDFYGAKEVLGWADHPNLVAYLERFTARPAVQKGLVTPPRD
ncbi:MAG: glutathione S-transferase C-terminal domain-containing protein, partial [Pseudooceanicola sp.]|nr:glutathione S-transferase C-terminal domain-containing protein [Pseudooceanicola sp.]